MKANTEVGDRSGQTGQIAAMEVDDVWQQTLGDLRLQMAKATFEKLLLGSRALGWDAEANAWTIEVRYHYSPAWLRARLAKVIERALVSRLNLRFPEKVECPAPQVEYVPAQAALRVTGARQESQRRAEAEPGLSRSPNDAVGDRSQTSSQRQVPLSQPGWSGNRSQVRPIATDPVAPRSMGAPRHAANKDSVTTWGTGKRSGARLGPNDYYIRLKTAIRAETLGLLKGPKLSVFLCLALHQDEAGISTPGLDRIARETQCCRTTVIRALQEMCTPELPLLEPLSPSAWGTNRYRVRGYASFGSRLAPALLEEG